MRLLAPTLSIALLFVPGSVVGVLSFPLLFAVITPRILWWVRFG